MKPILNEPDPLGIIMPSLKLVSPLIQSEEMVAISLKAVVSLGVGSLTGAPNITCRV